ncbi:MAG: YeeE/YedE thiosulfate transporter family protein, partial [Rhodospirillaceae bacterium]
RLQYPDGDRDLIDAIFGGALMGIGGVFAFGCTVGNGLSGVSVLSVGSALAWAAIMIGGYQAANRKFRVAD